ncbi:MAG: exodeoxyribonuclease VII large subunit [Lachnospiraceae bacterium]|nr:exodeoxyribonuclease VII large subunit [Lachnospiraceae bacterium]
MSRNIYSVGQVNAYIKDVFDGDFLLRNLSVQGEISNCKYHGSGHIYFTLKDEAGAISGIMFKGNRIKGLRFPMKDGDMVVVTGSVSVYEKGGTYQIYAREITLAGAGDLYVRFEQLKQELEEMGMFAPEYKKPIPGFARRIGIVTAPTGAAVRDIIQISRRRNPFVELILYPALVQGEGAVESIISGIMALDAMDLDVLIVGRGGGSIEDLWAFNEEAVARAIFSCNTPVISAVGHETDTTICDYVADLRAPTPSAAAEQAVFSYQEWQNTLNNYRLMLGRAMSNHMEAVEARLAGYTKQLGYLSPANRLDEKRQYAIGLEQRLASAMEHLIEEYKGRLALYAGRLDGLSPAKKLSQGYSYTMNKEGKTVTSTAQVAVGDTIEIFVSDGALGAQINQIKEDISWKKN